MATQQQISSIKKKADAIQKSLNDSVASGQIKSTPKGQVLGASTDAPAGSLKDLSIALAPQNLSSGGSIKDLSIGLAKGNKITQDDITRAQSGGASLASLSAPVSPSTGMSSPSTSPTQTSNQTGVSGGKKGYYSRYGGKEEPVVETPSYEEIQKQMMKDAQKQVNSLHKYEQSLLAEQQTINQQNDRSTQSVNVLSGLAGSSEANIQQQKTTAQGQQANKQIMDAVNVQVQSVLANVRKDAQDAYRFERTQANADQTTRDAHAKVMRDNAIQNVSALAGSGATAEGYKATDPEGYAHLAQTVGGEDVLKGMFTLNRPQETIEDKKIVNGNYVIAYRNPLDGKMRVETVDLGLPPELSASADLGNKIMFYDPSDPTKQMFVDKGLTPSQQQQSSTNAPTANLSPLAQNIYDNPALINNLTPTQKGKVLTELANNGLDLTQFATEKVTVAQREQIAGFDGLLREANNAASKLQDTQLDTGVIASSVSKLGALAGMAPDFTEYRSMIDNFGSALLKLRSGAAVTPQEFTRIAGFIPSVYDDEKTAQTKINRFIEETTAAQKNYVERSTQTTQQIQKSMSTQGGDIESQKQELRSQGYSEEQIDQLMNS